MIQSNVEWRSPPTHSFLIFILYRNNDHIIKDTDRRKRIMWNIIKVSKGGFCRIRFISDLRNKQVNPDLFTGRFGLKRYSLQIILSKQVMKLIKGIW